MRVISALQRELRIYSGVHVAAVSTRIPALHRRVAWLGGVTDGEDLFPRTDGEHLSANRVFFCNVDLPVVRVTTRAAYPCSYREPVQACQTREGLTAAAGSRGVFLDDEDTSAGLLALNCNGVSSMPQPASNPDWAIWVFASVRLTSPIKHDAKIAALDILSNVPIGSDHGETREPVRRHKPVSLCSGRLCCTQLRNRPPLGRVIRDASLLIKPIQARSHGSRDSVTCVN
jgi:hypothetical protein